MSDLIPLDGFRQSVVRTARTYDTPLEASKCALAVAALGLVGEAGEAADVIKKHVGHDHPLDLPKLHKEMGDNLYYLELLAILTGTTLQEIAKMNVEKLAARYPEGFTVERSFHKGQ